MLLQIVNLILSGKGEVAGRGDYFNLRRKNLESKIETHLVVAGSCRTVGNGICTDFLGIFYCRDCLEDTLGTYGYRISAVAEHVARNHIFYTLVVVILSDVESGMRGGSETFRLFGYHLQLLFRETAGVGDCRVHLIPEIF